VNFYRHYTLLHRWDLLRPLLVGSKSPNRCCDKSNIYKKASVKYKWISLITNQSVIGILYTEVVEIIMKQPFIPHQLPPDNVNWKNLAPMIGKATAELARYDGLLQTMINPNLLLSPITTNEAVLSSRIEGTQATLEEVLEYEAGTTFDQEKIDDIQEISNYRKALLSAEEALNNGRSLSLSLIKSLHQILMQGVRGQNKSPGQFRDTQNFIGAKGRSIEEATFVPPSPFILYEYLEKWMTYINTESGDVISQLGVIHAQFEIIHPFKDGNGRMGRILIPLYLYQKRFLHRPMFYLSEFLEEHRDEYCASLGDISESHNWQRWIEFFLLAVETQARRNFEKAKQILNLYNKLKPEIVRLTKSVYAIPALDAFFARPILSSKVFMESAGIPTRITANTILSQLKKEKILKEIRASAGNKPAIYALPDVLNIAEGKVVV
jgi:Fic family protein